jgi:hypothetical protein
LGDNIGQAFDLGWFKQAGRNSGLLQYVLVIKLPEKSYGTTLMGL